METLVLLYLAFLLIVMLACIIIVFHLLRYSLNTNVAKQTTFVFIIVTVIVVIINVILFTQLPFDELTSLQLF